MKCNLAMMSMFRDETRFLREWVEYHRIVGVDRFYLLCCDDAEELPAVRRALAPYEDILDWAVFDDRSENWQMRAWIRLLDLYGDRCKWACMTDVDAFLLPMRGDTVPPLLEPYDKEGIAGVGVYVSTFGDSGLRRSPALQVRDLVCRAPLDAPCNWTANFIIRPDRNEPAGPVVGYRMPLPGFRMVDTAGVDVTHSKKRPGPMDLLRLNHYSIRSAEDWGRKVARGWPGEERAWKDPKHTLAEHKLAMLNRNEEYDDGMLRFVPRLEAALQGTGERYRALLETKGDTG